VRIELVGSKSTRQQEMFVVADTITFGSERPPSRGLERASTWKFEAGGFALLGNGEGHSSSGAVTVKHKSKGFYAQTPIAISRACNVTSGLACSQL